MNSTQRPAPPRSDAPSSSTAINRTIQLLYRAQAPDVGMGVINPPTPPSATGSKRKIQDYFPKIPSKTHIPTPRGAHAAPPARTNPP
jgi:hypothetical protein